MATMNEVVVMYIPLTTFYFYHNVTKIEAAILHCGISMVPTDLLLTIPIPSHNNTAYN